MSAPLEIAGPFTLGTVQLGDIYGFGEVQPSTVEGGARAILDTAAESGIMWLDTARAYGKSEARIGEWLTSRKRTFHVVTKIRSLASVADADAGAATRASLSESLDSLGLPSVDICLTHRPDDLLRPAVARALAEAKSSGLVKVFGGSAYSCQEVEALLDVEGIGALQIPMSVVNGSFRDSGLLTEAYSRGVAIFVRSVFLQGALLMKRLPPHLSPLQPVIANLRALANEIKVTLPVLLMDAVRSVSGVSSLVLGVDSTEQLKELVAAACAPRLEKSAVDAAFGAGRGLPDPITDPRHWPRLS